MRKKGFISLLLSCVLFILLSELAPITTYAKGMIEDKPSEENVSGPETLRFTSPYGEVVNIPNGSDISKLASQGYTLLDNPKILEQQIQPEFEQEEAASERAVTIIAEKYGEIAQEESHINNINDNESLNEYTLTKEDEDRVEQAVSEYLAMVDYNPNTLARGIGRHWWNSRRFVANVLDIGLIAIGIGASARSAQTLAKLVRANRRNITRVVEQQIQRHVRVRISGYVAAGLNIISVISGVSFGYAIAWCIDYVDGRRLDGYIFA